MEESQQIEKQISFEGVAEYLNGKDFCSLIRIHAKSLQKAVDSKRITPELHEGRKMYHARKCVADYVNNTQVMVQNADILKYLGKQDVDGILKAKAEGTFVKAEGENHEQLGKENNKFESLTKNPEYMDSKKKTEKYNAKLKELEYQKKAGEVVNVKEIQKHFFKIARDLRTQLLNLPAKLAPALAAENDLKRIEIYLNDEITRTLKGIVNDSDS